LHIFGLLTTLGRSLQSLFEVHTVLVLGKFLIFRCETSEVIIQSIVLSASTPILSKDKALGAIASASITVLGDTGTAAMVCHCGLIL